MATMQKTAVLDRLNIDSPERNAAKRRAEKIRE